jgi:hypothetical protein
LIPKDYRWKYSNLNPSTPTFKGQIKLHKPGQPIIPVVKWRGAPAYKLSKLFTQKINNMAPLPNTFNISTKDLFRNLQDTPMQPHYKLASLDITNLYSNIPIDETRIILANTLEHHGTDPQTQQELLIWYNITTGQNYFVYNHNVITQRDGLAIGDLSSGLIAEFFLQHTENRHLASLSHKNKIINHIRYVDIIVIYDSTHTDIQNILTDFNAIHPNLQSTAEIEVYHTLNNLDISIHRSPKT